MLKFICDINDIFGNIALSGFIGLLLGFYYFFHRSHDTFRQDFAEFSKAFLPAFEMVKDKQITFEQIIFSEFPKHKEATAIFLHIHPLAWYRHRFFDRKWKEYEKTYNDLKDYLKPLQFPEALLVARRGSEKDIKRKQQFLKHLQLLLKIARQY